MPQKYNRKTTGPNYTLNDLLRAVQDIRNKNHTYNEVEQIYGVPIAVVYNPLKGRFNSVEKMGAGRSITLSQEAENELENCIKAKARMVYSFNKLENKPQLIFNTDESGFCTGPKRLKAIGEKGKGTLIFTLCL
ncbi:hypothetical protein RN001_012392 [Aquatica leii]|uniref:Transposase n=1 Tax=Aquatica leii TaxID=1421715 RepID=A0AAN7SPG8_9COLE|nr:hypothetical protein RN001_012392 [Aquatica leii]